MTLADTKELGKLNMTQAIALDLSLEKIRAYCATQPIERLSLLGTDFDDWLRPDTNTGMLVEYSIGAPITFIDMSRQERELAEFIGSPVDLRTPNELQRHHRQKFMNEATLVFAKNSRE